MKKINILKIFLIISMLFLLISNCYFIYSLISLTGIETLIRIIVIFILILLVLCILMRYLRTYYLKKKTFKFYTIFILIYSIILFIIGSFILSALNTLGSVTTDTTTYSVSLVTKKGSNITNNAVGYLTTSNNDVEKELIEEIKKEKNLSEINKSYEDYVSLINDLDAGEVDYIILPSNYVVLLQNMVGLNINLETETEIVLTKEKKVKNEVSTKTLTEPFTVLLMGVDSEAENISGAAFNGDALMLITFNPKTLSTTILSIPRDSYVPITCFPGNRRNKITHAAWYGETCMVNTIKNFLDVKIDYVVKINFKGVVKLVDSLGGVEMEIPYSFCEQNSNREWGEKTIYVEEGLQLLNGEQALAYSRNRHPNPAYCSSKWTNYVSNDFIRGQHQQEVLKAILNKLKGSTDLNTIYSLLDTISNNLETNMTRSEILSLYNIGKDILMKSTGNVEELISMQRLYLSGIDAYIYDISAKQNLYDYVLYEDSILDVSNAMKENLGLKEKENITTFSFDGEEEYEERVIGKGDYKKLPDYKVIPDFIGDSRYQSGITAANLGLRVTYEFDENAEGVVGTVVKQSATPGTLVSKVSTLVLTIKKEKTITTSNDNEDDKTTSDEKDEKNDDKETTSSKDEEVLDDLLPKEE